MLVLFLIATWVLRNKFNRDLRSTSEGWVSPERACLMPTGRNPPFSTDESMMSEWKRRWVLRYTSSATITETIRHMTTAMTIPTYSATSSPPGAAARQTQVTVRMNTTILCTVYTACFIHSKWNGRCYSITKCLHHSLSCYITVTWSHHGARSVQSAF